MSRARDTHGDKNAYGTGPQANFQSRRGGEGGHGMGIPAFCDLHHTISITAR